MSKRARFNGSAPVRVTWPPGEVYPEKEWVVEPGHWLPDDAPAALRDELLTRPDWGEVQQSSDKPAKSEEKD